MHLLGHVLLHDVISAYFVRISTFQPFYNSFVLSDHIASVAYRVFSKIRLFQELLYNIVKRIFAMIKGHSDHRET